MSKAEVPLKRSLSAPEQTEDAVDLDTSRIKGLRSELRRNKKRIRRLGSSLQGLQQETQQQKSALSYIERAWSQLQFELEQLLGTNRAESESQPSNANRLLELYTGASGKFAGSDPTRLAPSQLGLRVDEWATENDIENERRRLQSQQLEIDLAPIQPSLEERLGHTKQLVAELLGRISQGANGETPAANLEEFLAVRALKSENLAYRDICISLREQLLSAKLDLVVAEIRERQLNRIIANGDAFPSAADALAHNGSPMFFEQQAAASAPASSDDVPLPAQKRARAEQEAESKAEAPAAAVSNNVAPEAQGQIDDAQRRIEELTRQLDASHSHLQKMQLDLSKTESLRSGAEHRANQLYQESESLRHQLQAVNQKLNEHFAEMASKLEQASQASQLELNQLKGERNTLVEQVAAAQVLHETVQSLQTQIENYHAVYQSHDSQLTLAQQHREQAQQQASSLRTQLEEALARERALQQQLAAAESVDAAVQEALTQAQAVASKAEAEARNLSNQMNDLLTELDTIASDNRKLQAQNRTLVEQLGGIDKQRLQAAQQSEMMREANAAANAQIENLERRVQALKGLLEREEAFRDNFKTHEAQLLQQLGGAQDAYARSQQELFGLSQHTQVLASTIEQQRQELDQAAAQRAQLHEHVEALLQQNADLQKQLQEGRLDAGSQPGTSAEAEAEERGLDATERQIYEKLRNMLKCSVCENRFKNTVIVRCGHLFCDECVEASMRSRNRKCPACKERFGQDDVRRVYLS